MSNLSPAIFIHAEMDHSLRPLKDYFGPKSWILQMILTTIEYASYHQNFFVDYKWSKVSTNILVYDNLETNLKIWL